MAAKTVASPNTVVMHSAIDTDEVPLDGLSGQEVRAGPKHRHSHGRAAHQRPTHMRMRLVAVALLAALLQPQRLHVPRLHHPAGPHRFPSRPSRSRHAGDAWDQDQHAVGLQSDGHGDRGANGHPHGTLWRTWHHPLQQFHRGCASPPSYPAHWELLCRLLSRRLPALRHAARRLRGTRALRCELAWVDARDCAEQCEEVKRVKRFENGFILDPFTVSPDATLSVLDEISTWTASLPLWMRGLGQGCGGKGEERAALRPSTRTDPAAR